jgi:peroxiredoxin
MPARLQPGAPIAPFALTTLRGERVEVPDLRGRLVHLQFRRFAGCPVCNLHLHEVAARIDEITAAGIVEVALFYSTAEEMLPYQHDLPFHVAVDPDRALYGRFGVVSSVASILSPGAWSAMARGMMKMGPAAITQGSGGHLGLPGDFLVGADGVLIVAKYGAHADDQWSVDELLARAGGVGVARGQPRRYEDFVHVLTHRPLKPRLVHHRDPRSEA